MNITINKAMQRIGWRLSDPKGFKPNQNDVDSYNYIVDHVEDKQSYQLSRHELFAKMYIFVFGELIRHYKSSPDNDLVRKELNKIASKPMDLIIQEFIDKCDSETMNKIKTINQFKNFKGLDLNETIENLNTMLCSFINEFQSENNV